MQLRLEPYKENPIKCVTLMKQGKHSASKHLRKTSNQVTFNPRAPSIRYCANVYFQLETVHGLIFKLFSLK